MIWCAAIAMLLIALVNGVNLLLARGTGRVREMGVRAALGASRLSLVRALLTESAIVGVMAGCLAIVFATYGLEALRGILPRELLFSAVYQITVSLRVLVFTFILALGVGAILGVLPALQATRSTGDVATRSGIRATASRRSRQLRDGLVLCEVALAVMLLVGAGLFTRSLLALTRVDPGFDVDQVLLMDLNLSNTRYVSGAERSAFFHGVEARIEAIPGVLGATVSQGVPASTAFSFGVALQAEGNEPPEAQPQFLPHATVHGDFLEVLGIPLLAGRNIVAADAGLRNVLVDVDLAQFLWASTAVVGRRFRIDAESEWLTVVGVVADPKLQGPDDRNGQYDILYARADSNARAFTSLAIRTSGNPTEIIPNVRQAVRDIDRNQPIQKIVAAKTALAEPLARARFLSVLMLVLAGTAAVLAAVGLFGVLSYSVGERNRELGIRIALGAQQSQVRGAVLLRGLVVTGLGVLAGVALTFALSRLVQNLLFGVEPRDTVTFVGVTLLMLGVAAVASYLPAAKATQVDPLEVLNAE
jgi:predicted permease